MAHIFCILFHTMTYFLNNALKKTNFVAWAPETMATSQGRIYKIKRGVPQALLLFKLSFCLSFLYPLSASFLNTLSSPFPHYP